MRCERGLDRIGRPEAARHALAEHVVEPRQRRAEELVAAVGEQHVVPRQRIDERDLRAHQPGADDADLFRVSLPWRERWGKRGSCLARAALSMGTRPQRAASPVRGAGARCGASAGAGGGRSARSSSIAGWKLPSARRRRMARAGRAPSRRRTRPGRRVQAAYGGGGAVARDAALRFGNRPVKAPFQHGKRGERIVSHEVLPGRPGRIYAFQVRLSTYITYSAKPALFGYASRRGSRELEACSPDKR